MKYLKKLLYPFTLGLGLLILILLYTIILGVNILLYIPSLLKLVPKQTGAFKQLIRITTNLKK